MALKDIVFKKMMGRKGDGPSLNTMLAQFDKELENFQTLELPAPESKPRTPFDHS